MFKIKTIFSLILVGLIASDVDGQCTASICGSNGACNLANTACDCKVGFVGSRCQLLDPCIKTPCLGNGACYPVVQNVSGTTLTTLVQSVRYVCQCYSGFSGTNCQTVAAKPCTSNPCLNNGVCTNKPNSWDYYCNCTGPYTGPNCGTYVDYCANNLCQNKAVCKPDPVNKNYTCECVNGFTGTFCDKEINECIINPNNPSESPCINNGTCNDLLDGYFCECPASFVGTNCEIYVNPCSSNPCGSGASCTSSGSTYTCTCQQGFFGNPCQPNPCVSNPCRQANSTCLPIEAGSSVIQIIPGCTCTSSATYVCVCQGNNPIFASVIC